MAAHRSVVVSNCAQPHRWIPSRPRAKNSGPEGSPCCTSLLLGILSGPNQTKLPSTIRVARITVLGQAGGCSSDFAKKTGTVNLVESTPQIHGQQAPFFRRCRVFGAIVCLRGRWLHNCCLLRNHSFVGLRYYTMCSDTVASRASVVRKCFRRPPAFQETTKPGMLPSARNLDHGAKGTHHLVPVAWWWSSLLGIFQLSSRLGQSYSLGARVKSIPGHAHSHLARAASEAGATTVAAVAPPSPWSMV